MAIVTPLLSPADVEAMLDSGELPLDGSWELVDGEIVWLAANKSLHGEVCMRLGVMIFPFANSIGAKMYDGQTGFLVGVQRQQVRMPDVSLVTRDRLHIVPADGFIREAPDFAIEVLSQDEFGDAYARTKVSEYLAAGCKLVWLVDPYDRTVRAYEPGRREFTTYTDETDITLDAVAPGFSAKISSFFP